MGLVLFFAFFFLSCLPLLHSSEDQWKNDSRPNCPASFNCQNLGAFHYPFYNTTTDTRCGLCKVNCGEGVPTTIEAVGGRNRPLEILRNWPWSSILVKDPDFEQLLKNRSCAAFKHLLLPNSTFISPIIHNNITLFKCPTQPKVRQEMDDHFNINQYHYYTCEQDVLYYKFPNDDSLPPTNLPSSCEVITLPASQPDGVHPQTPSDLFSLLAAEFALTLHLTPDCEKCREIKQGLCLLNNECGFAKKEEGRISQIVGSAVVVFGAGAVILMIILCFCFGRKLSWRKKTENYLNVETFLKKNESILAPKRYSYSDVKKMTDSFKVKLGQGGYGSVYKGTLCNGNVVAVKVLNVSKGNGEDFINEVASVGRTSHVNIVSLLGFCFEGNKRALIYEFMPNGSLDKFIYDRGSLTTHQLRWSKLYEISIGIARGLEYLHRGCNTRILHFDIKPHNILLDQEFCSKISDFGLAKLFPKKVSVVSMSGMRGTPGYIAPEVFSRNFGVVSHKSDVYSYGMMVLEMVGGRKNIEVEVDHTSEIYFPHWIYKQIELQEELGLNGIMNEEENERTRKMIIVGLWCIQTDPSNRPSMARVLEMLVGSLESLQIPPKPFLSSPSRSPISSTVD